MSKLEEMKQRFLSEVSEKDIQYDWDAGWCYTHINHPIFDVAEEVLSHTPTLRSNGGSWSEYDDFEEFANEWLSEHEGMTYHMSDVVDGKLVNALGTWDEELEKFEGMTAREYAQGLVELIEKYHSDSNFYKPKLKELKEFING